MENEIKCCFCENAAKYSQSPLGNPDELACCEACHHEKILHDGIRITTKNGRRVIWGIQGGLWWLGLID